MRPVGAVLAATMCASVFGVTPARAAAPTPASVGVAADPQGGSWTVTAGGTVTALQGAPGLGSVTATLRSPIVGIAATPDGLGYWLVAADGGVFSFGDARFAGSAGGIALAAPVVGMAATPDGAGYWLLAADGGIFSFGDARFFGSTGGTHLARPVVGMASTHDGGGYWLVASDGGVFTFGDARFSGSVGGIRLASAVIGMAGTPDGGGYWLAGADGGIFSFGDAAFLGSTAGRSAGAAPATTVGLAASGGGYELVTASGATASFGVQHPCCVAVGPPPTSGGPGAVQSMIGALRDVSYYPADAGWTAMWDQWDPPRVQADLASIAGLHANTVRLILSPQDFDYPSPRASQLAELAQAVTWANAAGLRVQLTLFDLWKGYGDVTGSDAWASSILRPYANDPQVAFVEVQNEIDPTDPAAMAWARQQIGFDKAILGTVPVTISVAGGTPAGQVAGLAAALVPAGLDFLDYHFYGDPSQAYATLFQVRAVAGSTPLLIGEAGDSTVPGPGETQAEAEFAQLQWFEQVAWAARTLGLPDLAPWTLDDFAAGAIPAGIGVRATPDQYDYGLVRLDGSLKPAGAWVSAYFAGAGTTFDTNGSFEAGGTAIPLGWQPWHLDGASTAMDHSTAHSGGASFTMSATGGDASGVPSISTPMLVQPTAPGQRFTASVWAKGAGATGSTLIAISWTDATGRWLGDTASPPLPAGTSDWTLLTASGPAPAGATAGRIYLQSAYDRGTAWFDDMAYTTP